MSLRAVVGGSNPSNPQQASGAPTTNPPPGAVNTQTFVQNVQLPTAPSQRAGVGSNREQIMSGAPNPTPAFISPVARTAARINDLAPVGNQNVDRNISGAPVEWNPNSAFSNRK